MTIEDPRPEADPGEPDDARPTPSDSRSGSDPALYAAKLAMVITPIVLAALVYLVLRALDG